MTATLNVNLATCSMACHKDSSHGHFRGCAAFPVLVPCPIPPTFEVVVRLGVCVCLADDHPNVPHSPTCPARPIRVTCTITGKTWKESEVADILEPGITSADMFCACRARWALVKALVMGKLVSNADEGRRLGYLVIQRNPVFSAFADMVRHEGGLQEAAQRAADAMGADGDMSGMIRASGEFLAAYVARLIAQVGSLT